MRNKLMAVLLLAGVTVILAACTGGAATQAPTSAPPEPTAIPAPTESPATMLGGRLLFSRFIEATHTFTGMFVSRAGGTAGPPAPPPGPGVGDLGLGTREMVAVLGRLGSNPFEPALIAPDRTV